MTKGVKVAPYGGPVYYKDDLMELDPELLRALLRERVHHNIEVPFYSLIQNYQGKVIKSFGQQAILVYEVWQERGLDGEGPDIEWAREYVELAKKIQNGEEFTWDQEYSAPFNEEEMKVVEKLIYERRSIRDWIDKPVPDEMIEKILDAGRMAPIGCNLDHVRFIVLKDPDEHKMVWSDISTKNAVLIMICYDTRIPKVVGQDKFVPHNPGYDAAAAGDHMLLMAHALGLGACWLSKTVASDATKDTGKRFKEQYGLPDYIEVALHIAVGWPASGTIKTQRMPLKDMIID